ncbi:Transglutaminase [Rubrivivax sp. A210]|uniref:SirB1 family protein n=1 Tax=Rubrivivax sp. A210 TaxID=2772301 RepID=UPI0019188F03|nr:transglutaminase-like domain-containing protein [Rubrivivax sp. A210]CAD5373844.1 Transglutaminase [Rubrivivax sp. A210]
MAGLLPFATPTALDYFAALVADDSSLPLLEAAFALALDDDPGLDVQGELARIDALAENLRSRIPADTAPLPRLRLLNRYFFDELGFAGNVNHYYDPCNSLLPAVLQTRRGIPITLALLYIEFAAQIGLSAQGVSFPGHFLVKIHLPRGEVVIDPFSGQSLSRDELDERLAPYLRQEGLVGDNEVPLGLFLQPAPARDVLARMLRNLKEIHRQAGDARRLVGVLERLVVLLPQDWDERRDLALALADVGRHAGAAHELSAYLLNRPQADDAPALRHRLQAWRRLG